jgi:hypothetical protein
MRQHGTPILINADGALVTSLAAVQRFGSAETRGYDEAFIQRLVLDHPALLPLNEIDPTCVDPVPVCDELPTRAGPVDVFMITPTGMPVLVECKLWNNPQARREVVGQIIDYAKELQRWSYEDLQRACDARKGSDFELFEFMDSRAGSLDQKEFSDSVTRNLRDGRCVLLVVGDGIREGVEAISEYLTGSGALQFSFGLVELPVFETPDGQRLVTPRTLAKTTIIGRYVFGFTPDGTPRITDDAALDETDQDESVDEAKRLTSEENFAFWTDVLADLELDDRSQEPAQPKANETIYFWLPAPRGGATIKDNWITLYLARSSNQVGIFFTGTRTGFGGEIARAMLPEIEDILEELGPEAQQTEPKAGKINIGEAHLLGSLHDPDNRAELVKWMRERVNRYVNVFRPRVEVIAETLLS